MLLGFLGKRSVFQLLYMKFKHIVKEGRKVDMERVRSETKGEIDTAVDQLPFSDESFKVWR